MDKKFKPSGSFHLIVQRGAPEVLVSENRRYGYPDNITKAYDGVVLFIQKGLKNYYNLIQSTVNVIIKTQSGSNKPYLFVPVSFGWDDSLHNEKIHYKLGYMYDYLKDEKIAEKIAHLSGDEECKNPAVITELLPKTKMKNFYRGKTSINYNDLIVIIGKKGEVFFSQEIRSKVNRLRKRILFVEIDDDDINWIFSKYKPCFVDDNVISDNKLNLKKNVTKGENNWINCCKKRINPIFSVRVCPNIYY